MRYIGIGMAVAISLFLLCAATASASEWNMTIEASSQLENVTFGISPGATNGADMGIDEATTIPPSPNASYTQMALLYEAGAGMRRWINEDNTTWVLRVTVNNRSTTNITWNSSEVPPSLDITINDTDMRSESSMVLSGDAGGSVVYSMIIATDSTAPPPDNNTVSIADVTLPYGSTQTVPIRLLNSTGVGGGQVTLTFNESIVNTTNVVAGDFDNSTVFSPDYSNVSDGVLRVTFMKDGANLTGNLTIATVTLHAVAASGSCELGLYAELSDKVGTPVSSNVSNGTFTISELANMAVTATPSNVTVNTSTSVVFNVTSDGTPVSGATVTLSGAFSNVSTTEADGTVTIEVNATSTGTINVTATKDDHATAETTVTVNAGGAQTLALEEGYNTISLSVGNVTYDSYTLLQAIPDCTNVLTWDAAAGRWYEAYWFWGSPAGDEFDISPGVGYIVSVDVGSSSFKFTGAPITTPLPLNLKEGYNTVGIPYSDTSYDSYTLLQAIPDCTNVLTWDAAAGRWYEAYWFWGSPAGDEFDISPGVGYIVSVDADTVWTP